MSDHNPYQAPPEDASSTTSPPPGPDAEIVSRFDFTPEHLLTTLAQYRKAGRRLWSRVRITLGAMGLLAALVYLRIDEPLPAVMMLVCGVVLLLTQRLNNYFVIRAFRASPHFQTPQTLRFTADKVRTESPIEETTVQWTAFTEAVFFENGVLLYRGRHIINWVPDDSLTTGSPALLRSLVASKLPSRLH